MMLFWLRPSRQIRPPIYSSKQSKIRKRRVLRYSVLYFSMFLLFFILIVGPVIANKFKVLPKIDLQVMDLMQPEPVDIMSLEKKLKSTKVPGGAKKATSAGTSTTGRRIRTSSRD